MSKEIHGPNLQSAITSVTLNADEDSAKEEARRHVKDGNVAYSKADVVVKLQGWDSDHAKSVAQASLSALKQLILSDKKLPGTTLRKVPLLIISKYYRIICMHFLLYHLIYQTTN